MWCRVTHLRVENFELHCSQPSVYRLGSDRRVGAFLRRRALPSRQRREVTGGEPTQICYKKTKTKTNSPYFVLIPPLHRDADQI